MKISEKIEGRSSDEPFISFEYFPPRTDEGLENLYKRIETMKEYDPLFTDFTWGAGGSTADLTMAITMEAKRRGLLPNMHLTCTNMEKETVHEALRKAKEAGIRNILALRGDPPQGQTEWAATEGGFKSALCLVKFIRENYGSYFHVGVAGYPEGHPNKITVVNSQSELSETEKKRCATIRDETGAVTGYSVCRDAHYEEELDYLFEKVKAGADMIFTQMFFEAECYMYFVERCRAKGISVPIIPGVMCINTVPGFKRMVSLCKTRVPDELWAQVEATPTDCEDAGRQLGINFGRDLCRRLLDFGVPGLHFYCLNHDKVPLAIVDHLGLGPKRSVESDGPYESSERKADSPQTAAPSVGDKKGLRESNKVPEIQEPVTSAEEVLA